MKNDEFCGKTFKFLPKICLCLFKYKGVKPTSMSNKMCKYVENEISNSISHKNKKQKKKRKREEQRHIQLYPTLVTLLNNFRKLLFLPLVVRP